MAYRGITLGRLPIIGPDDTLFFMSVSTMLFAAAITAQQKNRSKMLLPMAGLSIFLTVLSLFYKPHTAPLPPVLKTFWFESHVALSFFAYPLFGIAAVLGLLFLKNRDLDSELLQYKVILVGFCMFRQPSYSVASGHIWPGEHTGSGPRRNYGQSYYGFSTAFIFMPGSGSGGAAVRQRYSE